MKFIHYLETITGVAIYPLISLLLFFSFFSLLGWWAIRANKNYIKALKEAEVRYDVTLLKEYLDYHAPIFKRQAQTKIKEIENSKSKENDLEELEKITTKKSIQAFDSTSI